MTDTKYNIQIFENTEFGNLRIITFNEDRDNIYFIGKEVAELFGDTNYRRSLGRLDDEDKTTATIETNGGKQRLTIITESGLYALLFAMQPQKAKGRVKSDTPIKENAIEARIEKLKQFKRWVTSEVLPSIRKTGGYVSNEDLFLKTYLPYADEQTKIMFKTQLATIKHLNDKVGELTVVNAELSNTNAALTEKINTWDMRNVLNALVRSWGTVCRNGDMKFTWNSIYKKLNYALNINIYGRKKAKDQTWLDVLSEKELSEAVKVVAALCEAANINVGKIVGKTNKQIIDDLPDIVVT